MASGAKSTFDVRRDNPAPSEEHRSVEEDLIRDKVPGSEGSSLLARWRTSLTSASLPSVAIGTMAAERGGNASIENLPPGPGAGGDL